MVGGRGRREEGEREKGEGRRGRTRREEGEERLVKIKLYCSDSRLCIVMLCYVMLCVNVG